MATSSVPRMLVVGARSGSGKSLLVTGTLMALRRKGLSVSCCVAGRSMQQATLLQRLSNRYVPNLDRLLMSDSQVLDSVGRAGVGADMVLIDGRVGLFDGDTLFDSTNSDAHLAELLSCPCVLIVDTHEVAPSLCAIVSGFIHHQHALNIVGVVINGLEQRELGKAFDSAAEREVCNALFSTFNLPPCLGCIPARGLQAALPSASMIQEENGVALPLQFLTDIEHMVSSSVDIDAILHLASVAPPIEYDELREVVGKHQCRVAVASDNCFHPCYQDNIALLQTFGADIVRFSPLVDTALPGNIGGLYLPGACLSDYAEQIESNTSLLSAIADFIGQGGIVFSEGGGSAILCRSFQPVGCQRAYKGVGSIPFEVYQGRCSTSPARGVLLDACLFGDFGASIGALYAGDWKIQAQGGYVDTNPGLVSTLRLEVSPETSFLEGYSVSAETFSTFQFLHFGSNPQFAQAFVEAASIHQRTVKSKRN